MARRNTRATTRRNPQRRAPAGSRAYRRPRRRRPFLLRWYHLVVCFISAFCLGYLVAFGHAKHYVETLAGLR